jgi:hypothetical protein
MYADKFQTKKEEGRGAIIILEVRCVACYPWLPKTITWEISESTTIIRPEGKRVEQSNVSSEIWK